MSDDQRQQDPRPRLLSPKEIAAATHLSREDKVGLLRQWERDLRQQMTATREGMKPPEPNLVPETLRKIGAPLRSLEESVED